MVNSFKNEFNFKNSRRKIKNPTSHWVQTDEEEDFEREPSTEYDKPEEDIVHRSSTSIASYILENRLLFIHQNFIHMKIELRRHR